MSKPKHVLSEAELSAIAGVSETSWKAHKAAGCPVPTSRKDLVPWAKRYGAWRRQHGKVDRAAAPSAAVDPELLQHKRELARYRALQLQLQMQVRQGELLPRKVVVDYASEAVLAAGQQMEAAIRRIAARLGPQTQGGAASVEAVVRAELDLIRERFAKSMARTHEAT